MGRILASVMGLCAVLGYFAMSVEFAASDPLYPRVPHPKHVITAGEDSEGIEYRLILKFTDDLKARVTESGGIQFLGEGDTSGFASIISSYDLSFEKLFDIADTKLLQLQNRAAQRSGKEQPDFAGYVEVHFKESDVNLLTFVRVGNELQRLGCTEYAELAPTQTQNPTCAQDSESCVVDSSYVECQGYLGADPGIEAEYAWDEGGMGNGIRFTDIESWWNKDHHDYPTDPPITLEENDSIYYNLLWDNNGNYTHADHCLGIVLGVHNDHGVDGIAPSATGYFYPDKFFYNGPLHRRESTAILNAAADSDPGDVILLEVATEDSHPLDTWSWIWDAIKTAVDAGIHFIEPAGNRGVDVNELEDYLGDNGAIMVGAGTPDTNHDWNPLDEYGSNYGERLNVQAWGSEIFTTGWRADVDRRVVIRPEDPYPKNRSYYCYFGGTSGASAITAGAVAAFQSYTVSHEALNTWEMRNHLAETGHKQGTNPSNKNVGPAINLRKAIDYYNEGWVNTTNIVLADPGAGKGVAWGDMDGDGDIDIYLSNSDDVNGVFVNYNSGASFNLYQSLNNVLGDDNAGYGVAWADFDNDGDLDIYLANSGSENCLFRNPGSLSFVDVATSYGVDDDGNGRTVAWGDYDSDGLVDLYVANDGANILYQNTGSGFNNVTAAMSVGGGIGDTSLSAAWTDFNNDGLPDLYVSNDGTANRLYVNTGVAFRDSASYYGVDDGASSRSNGCAWADFDNDGDMDLFVAGAQNTGNKLFRNNYTPEKPDTSFTEVAGGTDLEDDGGLAQGGSWADYDNDGDLDLYVSKVFYAGVYDSTGALYMNSSGTFSKQRDNALELELSSFGAAWGDYDEDGDLDMYMAAQTASGSASKLVRNMINNGNHWLHLTAVGSADSTGGGADTNVSAIGARAIIKIDDEIQMREVSGGGAYGSQNSLTLEFGFGEESSVDSLFMCWTDGAVDTITSISADQWIVVTENESGYESRGAPTIIESPPGAIFLGSYPNPFNPDVVIEYELPNPAPVELVIYGVSGRRIIALVEEMQERGRHRIHWNGRNDSGEQLAAGLYFCQLKSGSFSKTMKLTLLK